MPFFRCSSGSGGVTAAISDKITYYLGRTFSFGGTLKLDTYENAFGSSGTQASYAITTIQTGLSNDLRRFLENSAYSVSVYTTDSGKYPDGVHSIGQSGINLITASWTGRESYLRVETKANHVIHSALGDTFTLGLSFSRDPYNNGGGALGGWDNISVTGNIDRLKNLLTQVGYGNYRASYHSDNGRSGNLPLIYSKSEHSGQPNGNQTTNYSCTILYGSFI